MGKANRRRDNTRRARKQRLDAIEGFIKANAISRQRTPPGRSDLDQSGWELSNDLDHIPEAELYANRLEKPSHGKNRRHSKVRRTQPAGA